MFFKKKNKEKEKIKLFCAAEEPSSYSAIFLSIYRLLDIDIEWIDPLDSSEFGALIKACNSSISLIDDKFTICRTFPVITYLNIVGSKPKMIPRKARVLAKQNYYMSLIENKLWKNYDQIESEKFLFLLNQRLQKYKFIADNELTLADIYLFGFCMITKKDFSEYGNIKIWLNRMFDFVPSENKILASDSEFYKHLKERKIA
ncbi:MAG: hypothetical protein CMD72_00085 [Gammaproteobacteria bacterium]|nr:hypothetical protein [Gammaproteobacteria bacterium]|tara:strand:+ start:2394 stop:2999 length:606 start_codon:yes stop_codon:yes gene_type:complete